mmetsp:Transcript_11160/g.12617  ORF Transcript_11160/g.12617 Transcript_11160/m.12617 type:complete len:192 (-) Transcript_11160:308-883(-)
MTSIPLIAWTGMILGESLDLVAETFMKKSGRFTNIKATSIAYLLDFLTTTMTIWCMHDIDFFTMYLITGTIEDFGAIFISLFVFKESLTISKIIAVCLILASSLFLMLSEQDYDDDDERWAPWPSSWDEPLWGTGSSKEAAVSIVGPIAIDASFTTSESGSDCSSIDSSNSTDFGNNGITSIMDDNALLEL